MSPSRRSSATAPAPAEDLPFDDAPASKFTPEQKAEFLADPEVKAELQKVIAEEVAKTVVARTGAVPEAFVQYSFEPVGDTGRRFRMIQV